MFLAVDPSLCLCTGASPERFQKSKFSCTAPSILYAASVEQLLTSLPLSVPVPLLESSQLGGSRAKRGEERRVCIILEKRINVILPFSPPVPLGSSPDATLAQTFPEKKEEGAAVGKTTFNQSTCSNIEGEGSQNKSEQCGHRKLGSYRLLSISSQK